MIFAKRQLRQALSNRIALHRSRLAWAKGCCKSQRSRKLCRQPLSQPLSDRAFFDSGFDKVCDKGAKPALSLHALRWMRVYFTLTRALTASRFELSATEVEVSSLSLTVPTAVPRATAMTARMTWFALGARSLTV